MDQNSLDGDLLEAERARLIARYGRPFSSGETLFVEGALSQEAFLLQVGSVRLLKTLHRAERTLIVVKPGDLFGESALVDESARTSTAVALTDGVALAFDRATFRSLVEKHPALGVRILEQLVRRVRNTEEQLELLLAHDPTYKVVKALATLSRVTPSGLALDVSPIELAVRVRLGISEVKRIIQKLRDSGYVRIQGDRLHVDDSAAIDRLSDVLAAKEELAAEALEGL